MHWLIPFASAPADDARAALATLVLPNLARLLAGLDSAGVDAGEETSLTPPHERALAREVGLHGDDGRLPWAAYFAARDGFEPGSSVWALVTPAHCEVGADRVTLIDPDDLALDAEASHQLFDAVAQLLDGDGIELHWAAPTRWYATGELFADLPTASLDRVISRNVGRWLPAAGQQPALSRLQSEMQMVLHAHAVNAEREANAAASINTLWFSGCGRYQMGSRPSDLQIVEPLRAPALAGDWSAWCDAWHNVDDGPLAVARESMRLGHPVTLTLCGERSAHRFEARPRGVLKRLAARLQPVDPTHVLAAL